MIGVAVIAIGFILSRATSSELIDKKCFVISEKGIIQFANNWGFIEMKFQLQASSRASFLGCRLVLTPQRNSSTVTLDKKIKCQCHKFFIFKDSLTSQDFARLSRIIKRASF